jgi:hypothetical protein
MLIQMGREQLDATLGTGELPTLTERSLSRGMTCSSSWWSAERGWITAEGESHVSMCAVGAPVKLAGRPVAGISLSSLCLQSPDERFEELDSRTKCGRRNRVVSHCLRTLWVGFSRNHSDQDSRHVTYYSQCRARWCRPQLDK